MPISAGTRLGLYEVIAPLGAGGMGEVYRARDTKKDSTKGRIDVILNFGKRLATGAP
jgi:serine/threonine protein kinase